MDQLHHWPEGSNPASITAEGRGDVQDVQAGGIWLEGPPEKRHPRNTWPASRNFRRRTPNDALLVPEHIASKLRLHLFELVEEDAEKGKDIAKMESAAGANKETEGNTTDQLLLAAAAQEDDTGDDAASCDLTETAKMESAMEEADELAKEIYKLTKAGMGDTEGTGPEEIPRDAAQEDVTADDPGGAIPDELQRESAVEEFAA